MTGLIVRDALGEGKQKILAKELAQAGDLNVRGVQYARKQTLTARERLDGKRVLTPSVAWAKENLRVITEIAA